MIRHRSILAATTTMLVLGATPTPSIAASSQTFTPGAELLGQNASGQWDLNLFVAAAFSTDDGSPVSPVRRMQMSFPSGARFNAEAFGTCTLAKAEIGNCTKRSEIGEGKATAQLGPNRITANITVYNGPGNASRRQIFLYSNALGTIEFTLTGTMRRTSGTYGYVLDVIVPPIVEELVPGGVPIIDFVTTVGGTGRRGGKPVPLVSSPTRCRGGWQFAATFTYANGSKGTNKSVIPCRLTAVPVS